MIHYKFHSITFPVQLGNVIHRILCNPVWMKLLLQCGKRAEKMPPFSFLDGHITMPNLLLDMY